MKKPILSIFTISLFLLLTTSCGDINSPQQQPPGNNDLLILTANHIYQTKTGVAADGQEVFTLPVRTDSAMIFENQTTFRYRTLLRGNTTGWMRHFTGFTATLNQAPPTAVYSDTDKPRFVFNHLDLGDLKINQTDINFITEMDTDFADNSAVDFDIINFKSYWFHILQYTVNQEQDEYHELQTPLAYSYLNNKDLSISGTGSSQVKDFSTDVSISPAPELLTLNNGSDINFRETIPNITPDNDLTLSFSQTLKAKAAYLTFTPLMPDSPEVRLDDIRDKALIICVLNDTDEIVIPAASLDEIKENSEFTNELYALHIISYSKLGAVDLESLTEANNTIHSTYNLPVVHMGSTQMFVNFSR